MSEVMRFVETSKPIDLSDWYWTDRKLMAAINDLINKAVTEGLNQLFAEHPPRLSLPIRWTRGDGGYGKPVTDPATIYLHLPLDEKRDGEHNWEISLAEMIADAFWSEYEIPRDTETYEPSEQALALAKRLRVLADSLECGPPDWHKAERQIP
jgi:putative NIF3 family GTP cyclohydrolase 1 type 2